EIDPSDVLHPNKRTVRIRPDDDLSEFLRRLQPTLRAHCVSKFLPARNRFASYLARRIHIILLLHRADDVWNRNTKLRELVRFHPQAHRVLARAENMDASNSTQSHEM